MPSFLACLPSLGLSLGPKLQALPEGSGLGQEEFRTVNHDTDYSHTPQVPGVLPNFSHFFQMFSFTQQILPYSVGAHRGPMGPVKTIAYVNDKGGTSQRGNSWISVKSYRRPDRSPTRGPTEGVDLASARALCPSLHPVSNFGGVIASHCCVGGRWEAEDANEESHNES
ncbi:hypothetical protein B0H10DRAFT_1949884 [Mycena sp. CBHHK59/15]|nr:hypothetical protein B0H10DRAFT_1949884 [Mycena sp. CBHHK59/15]